MKVFLLLLLTSSCWASIGEDNNNPGNIRSHNYKLWHGAIGVDPWMHVKFRDEKCGFLAIKRIIKAYKRKYGFNTCRQVACRWLGNGHTDKQRDDYTKMLCQSLGVGQDQSIDLSCSWTQKRLCHGIIRQECGRDIYPQSLYDEVFQ